jgi:hypothetical protein
MAEAARERFRRIGLGALLAAHPGLRAQPLVNGELRLCGEVEFDAEAPGHHRIADSFEIELLVPEEFPNELPSVRELTGRVPKSFHQHPNDGTLCLGSPTRQRLALVGNPTLLTFMTKCVIPYLYGFTHKQKHGTLPFGELGHGNAGLLADFAALFGVMPASAHEMVRLASLKRRIANKCPCPCGSGKRLGRCHNRRVNRLRDKLGRHWFRAEYARFANLPRPSLPATRTSSRARTQSPAV